MKKPKSIVTFVIGILLAVGGIISTVYFRAAPGLIPVVIGGSLFYLGWQGSRTANLIFGHSIVVVGCVLVTWGMYLLPHVEPKTIHIFTFPLFWGLICIFGGICSIFHGFCNCIRRMEQGYGPKIQDSGLKSRV